MEHLPVYSGSTTCPKCGCAFIGSEYRAQRPQLGWSAGDRYETVTPGAGGECMLRICQECGWAWLEACADTVTDEQIVQRLIGSDG